MKRHFISIVSLCSILALLLSCATIPKSRKYKPEPAQEKEILSGPLLVGTEWLAAKSSSFKLRLIDYGRTVKDYQAGHIPGAVFLDRKAAWDKVDGMPGMLPPVETLVQAVENAGISNDSIVVIYDDSSGLWASRFFWALEYLGHRDVRILEGGWKKWLLENREVQKESYVPPRGRFVPRLQYDLLAKKDWILGNMSNPDVQIIDTRSPKEYTGDDVRAARGGHIPGAVNINWTSNLKSDNSNTFASEERLVELYDSHQISKNNIIVTYCQTGVRGTHTYFILKLLGYPNVRVYDGSWAEWGNNMSTPVITESIISPK